MTEQKDHHDHRSKTSNSTRNIVLVGFMGTGKTSAGKSLAKQLKMTFTDMDDIIQKREGKPIPLIFAEDGEPYFRSLERNIVRELSAESGLVIATGGGIVLNQDNINDFSRTGLVVCLSADPGTILERVASDTTRPLLAGNDKLNKILTILEARRHLYNAIPHRVDTTRLTVDEVVNQIMAIRAKEAQHDQRL